jgi:(2S)-methylsuccinyl-CoA dehydrogenase
LTLEERFALLFAAEALQAVRNRLSARPADFGLDDAWLSATVDAPAVRGFCMPNCRRPMSPNWVS